MRVLAFSTCALAVFGLLLAQQQPNQSAAPGPQPGQMRPNGAPSAASQQTISIEEFDPKSTLVVPEHHLTRSKFPFIDVHNHNRATPEHLDELIKDMDSLNMRLMVLSPVNGSFGEKTAHAAQVVKGHKSGRFVTFTNIDFNNPDDPDYSKRAANQLEQDIKAGAVGLKVWRTLGMYWKDSKGQRIHVDDARLDGVWDVCAKYNIPVLIHTADPKGLFEAMDKNNERWLELKLRSGRNHMADTDATWDTLISEQHSLFRKHPKTKFIAAHMGWLTNNLGELGRLMDEMPNLYAEIGAITSDLGRQPRYAHDFFIKYQDRIMFGKDAYNVPEYFVYFRLLETADDYFDPIRKYHGLWKLYGLNLPDEVLKKVYYKNALRVIPGLNSSGFPQ